MSVMRIAEDGHVVPELLASALTVRESLGRINDLIHACGILLVLPHILGDEERITVRPSLGAGNDPSRPYDLETVQRIAELKLARWRGADAMRKRQTFKDLVMLAADTSGRRSELFVIGPEPCRFLTTSTSTAAWALDRSPGALRTFTTVFGTRTCPSPSSPRPMPPTFRSPICGIFSPRPSQPSCIEMSSA